MFNPVLIQRIGGLLVAGFLVINGWISTDFERGDKEILFVTAEYMDVIIPEIHGDNAPEKISNLYQDLGWDGKTLLNPTDYKVNEKEWKRILSEINKDTKTTDETLYNSFMWMNKGFSGDDNIPNGVVRIQLRKTPVKSD